MPKLVMLKGISGSGKSTIAKKMTSEQAMYRVNRDELRLMMYSGKWAGDKEKAVVAAQRAMVTGLLQAGKNVVVDDTNLLDSHLNMWKQIAESVKPVEVKFEVKEIKTPLEECIARDKQRTGKEQIGEAIIQRQAIKSGMYNVGVNDNDNILCDIDGTIANGNHREPLLEDKKDRDRWLKYFALCHKDEPIKEIIDQLHGYRAEGKKIILVSGRAADLTLDQTVTWLKKHNVPYDRLLMRLGGDGRPDTEVKKDILREFLIHHPKSSILTVIDDRPSVVRMWRENGLPVQAVGPGIEF